MNIVFLDAETVGELPQLEELKKLGDVTLHPHTAPDQTAARVRHADIVLTNKVVLDRAVLEQAPNLRLICVTATGTNNVDSAAAQERGIAVKNAVGYAVESVTQLTFGLLLGLVNQTAYFNQYVLSGGYAQSKTFTHLGPEYWLLSGKRLGIVGLGNIGRGVAAVAEAFGMDVAYSSTSGQERPEKYPRLQLDELLRTSDVVSVHAPLNPKTQNLIDFAALKKMKPTAILLNTGRGGVVNEADLARAIDEDVIAGAGLDVFEREPAGTDNPLLRVQKTHKLLLTPHIAWAARETRSRLMDIMLEHIQAFLKTQQAQQ